jgi:hypothetical protein
VSHCARPASSVGLVLCRAVLQTHSFPSSCSMDSLFSLFSSWLGYRTLHTFGISVADFGHTEQPPGSEPEAGPQFFQTSGLAPCARDATFQTCHLGTGALVCDRSTSLSAPCGKCRKFYCLGDRARGHRGKSREPVLRASSCRLPDGSPGSNLLFPKLLKL